MAGILALVGFLFALLLATLPQLHEAVHEHDATAPAHLCVVSVISQGVVSLTVPALTPPPPPQLFFWISFASEPSGRRIDTRLSPSRAPPAGIS